MFWRFLSDYRLWRMKRIYLLGTMVVFLYCPMLLMGQENGTGVSLQHKDYQKELQLSILLGANIDLVHATSNEAAKLIGERKRVAPVMDVRVAHLFAKHWGWYADFRFKYYESKRSNIGIGDAIGTVLLSLLGLDKLYFAYSVGGVYRIEGKRWQCYPRIGVGQSFYGWNRERSDEDGMSFECNSSTWCLDFGVAAQYRLTQKVALMLDVLYQQPLDGTEAYLRGEAGEIYSYHGTTMGRELNVRLGVNFCFQLGKK